MENANSNENTLSDILSLLSEKPASGFTRVYNRYSHEVEEIRLNLLNKISLALFGYTKVEKRRYEGWTGENTFYAYKSKEAGQSVLLFDYPHGYANRLDRGIILAKSTVQLRDNENAQKPAVESSCCCSGCNCSSNKN